MFIVLLLLRYKLTVNQSRQARMFTPPALDERLPSLSPSLSFETCGGGGGGVAGRLACNDIADAAWEIEPIGLM
jgi:hypothetical protein